MIDVANHGKDGKVPVKDISERQGVSVKYLEQIATTLTKAGLLQSGRGANGGYALTRPPAHYKIGDILRAIEGSLAPVACLRASENPCVRKSACPTLRFWEGLRGAIDSYVNSVTLQDLTGTDCGL